MRKYFLNLLAFTLLIATSSAKADVHSLGADGPAAIEFIGLTFADNVNPDDIDCSIDPVDLVKTVLSAAKNKKIIGSANNKNVKGFLKNVGVVSPPLAFFKSAAEFAVESLCSDNDDEIGDDEDSPEFED